MQSGRFDTRIQILRKDAPGRVGRSRVSAGEGLVADCLAEYDPSPMGMKFAAAQNLPSGAVTFRITREPDVESVDQNCFVVIMDNDAPGDRFAVISCRPHPKDQRGSLEIVAAGDGQA